MAKKPALTFRKPPAPVDLTVAERFVQNSTRAGGGGQTSGRSGVRGTGLHGPGGLPLAKTPRAVLARKDGRELRRMTLYLPSELARRLAVYCAEHDLEMSDVVTAAVQVHFGAKGSSVGG